MGSMNKNLWYHRPLRKGRQLALKKILIILCNSFFLFIIVGSSFASVHVNIGIHVPPPPPPLLLPAPPDVFIIPGTYAYFPPKLDVDIVFYGGYWYRPYQGYWYQSTSYNGKWVYIEEKRLPKHIHDLPRTGARYRRATGIFSTVK